MPLCSLRCLTRQALLIPALLCTTGFAQADDPLAMWRSGVTIRPVAPHSDRHVIHSYFNTSPESPDGRFVVYYTSRTAEGELGDIRILERSTGKETIVARNIVTEDAHRAACQQWSNNGKTVVYHEYRNERWFVMAVDVDTREQKVLAEDRQVCFGSPASPWVPIYGCHWNPGKHRDLQLVNVETGEIKTVVKAEEVVNKYGDWIQEKFGTTDISIFFPIMSPGDKRVFFKLSHPSGTGDFRSKRASTREGCIVYDLEESRFLRLFEKWGHPSWSPDDQAIFNIGNRSTEIITGKSQRYAPSCFSNHPSLAPDGRTFVTDADVTKRNYGHPGDWAVAVGSTEKDEFVLLHVFGNTQGARTWRHNHPHPAFSADGRRVYYNINESNWTTLMVAEAGKK